MDAMSDLSSNIARLTLEQSATLDDGLEPRIKHLSLIEIPSAVAVANTANSQTAVTTDRNGPADIVGEILASAKTERGPELPDGEIILRTSDDVDVAVPRALLVKYSTFFADLLSIPTSGHANDGEAETVLPLPSATSTGLALVINVLRSAEQKGISNPKDMSVLLQVLGLLADPEPQDWERLAMSDIPSVHDALQLADAYDIPAFETQFKTCISRKMRREEPVLAFVLDTMTGDYSSARAMAAVKRLGAKALRELDDMLPKDIQAIVAQHDARAVHALSQARDRFVSVLRAFRQDLEADQRMYNGFNHYSRKCRGDGPDADQCNANKDEPDWTILRARAAAAAYLDWAARSNDEWYCVSLVSRSAIETVVNCRRCTTRFVRTFNAATQRFLKAKRAL